MSINSNIFINTTENNELSAFNLSRLQLNNEIDVCCLRHKINDDIKEYLKSSLVIADNYTDFSEAVEKAVLAYVDLFGDTVCRNTNTFLDYDRVNAYTLLDHDFLSSIDLACSNGLMQAETFSVLSCVADPEQKDNNSLPSFKKNLNSVDTVRPFQLELQHGIYRILLKGVFCESVKGSAPSKFETEASAVLNDDDAEVIADAMETFVIDNSDGEADDGRIMDALLGINHKDGRKAMVFITDFESSVSANVAIDKAALLQTGLLVLAKYVEEFSLDKMVGLNPIGKNVIAGPLSLSAIILNPAIAEMRLPNFRSNLISKLRGFSERTKDVHVFDLPSAVHPAYGKSL